MTPIHLKPSPVSDPLYYLHNAQMVIEWTLAHHTDLLLDQEVECLNHILQLGTSAKALLFRLMMRRGELFRQEALNYEEAEPLADSISELYRYLMVDIDPNISIGELTGLCRKAECFNLARALLPEMAIKKSQNKAELIALLEENCGAISKPLGDWWPECPFSVIRFNCRDLFNRIRLMFFGNLYQDWSEFVVTELGYQKYEPVELNSQSRAFSSRAEVDHYLYLAEVQTELKQGAAVEPLAVQIITLSDVPELSPWISDKLHRLLFELGHQAERDKDKDLALSLYELSGDPQAKLRLLRVMEKAFSPDAVLQKSQELFETVSQPELRLGIKRVMKRAARKVQVDRQDSPVVSLPTRKLMLSQPTNGSVEERVGVQLEAEGLRCFHVESRLMNTLFALFFWPAIYKPVTGAFFNPFQDKPADLYRPGFKIQRDVEIYAGFRLLEGDAYRDLILQRFYKKQYTACRLIHWPSISEELIKLSLALIPPSDLYVIFEYMFEDLGNHRRGLPDLICFDKEAGDYRLIEVKGPGDRLRDHQRLWLEHLHQNGIDAEVCYVAWAGSQN